MDLGFISTLAPNNTQIASVLINANVTGFDIEGSSIIVNDTSSSGRRATHHLWKWDKGTDGVSKPGCTAADDDR
ncbi:cell wall protein DAN4-like isoform X1 [Lates japonicus]|uniref:Cell wall protein DAN4-like isoform X1 n=1 Tax=Lates japonicus TaxID=270547 RepID=A0AAD3R3K9_LATJO|nr:cell wall protein DAN4-like isoform X1 [Lates japonicus]